MNTPSPSRWSELLEVAISIIDQANSSATVIDRWTLGGGTALMLQIDHRESHDIDLFVDDPQLLPFLNPETQDYSLDLYPSSYVSDGTRALKLVFDGVGEIDVICSGWLTEACAKPVEVKGQLIQLETPAEIIAKKVYHRGWNLQPRDMFDIAAVQKVFGDDYVTDVLSAFPKEVAQARNVAELMNPELARGVLSSLIVREKFSDLTQTAHASVVDLLARIPQ